MLGGLENPLHIILILVVVLMLFGAKRLPEMGKSLGTGLRGFKESLSGQGGQDDHETDAPSADPAPMALAEASQPVTPEHAVGGTAPVEIREVVRAVR